MYQRKLPKEYYCTIDYALDIFGGKWKPRLLCILRDAGRVRYGALKKAMENISDAALADSLKELQESGLIERRQYNEMPVRVEYSLSDLGKTLIPVLDMISDWAVQHSEQDIYQGGHFKQVHAKKFEDKRKAE
ncbi:MAG: helix-turn-helix transcriptional regulator [Lactobacillus sp.]|nr:helix-turn-helix transcriptional regulator [Lactobacillus sp.]MCI1973638.1 helix-turn-helix transcriptional regulator [Lactobacillus sp.]